jgi:hypothetical protein
MFVKISFRKLLFLACYLLQTNLVGLVEPSLFYQKLLEPTPQWVIEQIENDLAPFSKELSEQHLNNLFALYNEKWRLVRVRVAQGQLTFEKSNAANSYFLTSLIVDPIIQLHSLAPLPDMDFVITFIDESLTAHSPEAKIKFPSGPPGPIFCIAKNKLEPGMIVMPDWYALNDHLPDKASILNGRSQMLTNWQGKFQILFFRGADSGVFIRSDWRNSARPKLVALSLKYPDLIDAKFHCLLPWEVDSSIRDQMKEEGMVASHVPIGIFPQYRYLMDVDGHTANTPRTALMLYSGSVLFKQITNNFLWFYKQLKPYVHFIPVAEDLSDILSQIEWAKNHDAECQKIAENAYQLAEETLRPECSYLYLYRLLEAYSKKQREYY